MPNGRNLTVVALRWMLVIVLLMVLAFAIWASEDAIDRLTRSICPEGWWHTSEFWAHCAYTPISISKYGAIRWLRHPCAARNPLGSASIQAGSEPHTPLVPDGATGVPPAAGSVFLGRSHQAGNGGSGRPGVRRGHVAERTRPREGRWEGIGNREPCR